MTPSLFEQHLDWLQEHCDLVPYSSIPKLTASSDGERPIVAITFDDGYEDNYTHAFPALVNHGAPATVFVTTGLIEGDPHVVRRFSRMWGTSDDQVRGLAWSQILEMREGGSEFGAHTHSHPNLSKIEESRAAQEITNSKTLLEEHLTEPIRLFAYPFGKPRQHVSGRTIDLVARLGFESAATISFRGARPTENPLTIPRFPVTKDSVSVLAGKVYGRLDLIGLWQEHAPLWLSRLVSSDPSVL